MCVVIKRGWRCNFFVVMSVTNLQYSGQAGQKVSPKWGKGEIAKRAFHFLSWEVIGKPVFTPAAAAATAAAISYSHTEPIYITRRDPKR